MGDNATSYRGRTIIILSRDAMLTRAAQDGNPTLQYDCLRVTSPYQAAAELLAEPPLAMIIDLRCLTPGDLPLIEVARQRDVEVLAVGSVPLGITTTDLSGVRLAAAGHLPELLGTIAGSAVSGGSPGFSPITPEIRQASHSPPEAARSPDLADKPADPPGPASKADHDPFPESPDALLTNEELSALLEDES